MSMNRSQMLDILAAGGSVAWRDSIIAHPDQVPSVAELARGNPVAETVALNELQAQIARLQAQVESLSPVVPLVGGDGSPEGDQKPPTKPTGKAGA